MAQYVVTKGDDLTGIAHRFGFSDYNVIWNDPQNADLKAKRVNPSVLFPATSSSSPMPRQTKWQPQPKSVTAFVHSGTHSPFASSSMTCNNSRLPACSATW